MAVKSDVRLDTISYVIVYVRDTEKALPFYRDTLGMKVKSAEPGWVELETKGTTLALHGMEPGKQHPGHKEGQPIVVFSVEKIHESIEALKTRGVKIEGAPKQVCEAGDHVGMSVEFHDPDGNLYSLFGMEPRNK